MTADKMLEASKALRSQWLTAEALVFECGASVPSIRRYLRAGMAHGFLVSRQADKPEGKCGYAPAEFAVSKSWGGIA